MFSHANRARGNSNHLVGDYRAEDGLDDAGAGRVGDVHGVEPLPQRGVRGGVAAAAAAPAVGRAERQRPVQRHRRPCKQQQSSKQKVNDRIRGQAMKRIGEAPLTSVGA
jgi:hypothetical protein